MDYIGNSQGPGRGNDWTGTIATSGEDGVWFGSDQGLFGHGAGAQKLRERTYSTQGSEAVKRLRGKPLKENPSVHARFAFLTSQRTQIEEFGASIRG